MFLISYLEFFEILSGKMLHFLHRICDKCPYTRCGDTFNYIASVFQHEIDQFADLINSCNHVKWEPKKTVTKQYDSTENVSKIIDYMKKNLDLFGCLFVSLDIDDLEHSFVLFKIDSERLIMDSYIAKRKCQIRIFSYDNLSNLLINPSIEQWNKIFNCSEKGVMLHPMQHPEIFFEYIYEDKNLKQQEFYINDQPKELN
jgi:hypothetical protein